MGITVDSEKDMILCVTDAATSERAMQAIREKAGIKTPAHSICFTLPVDKTVGVDLPEENKVVITCLLTRGQSDAVLRMLVEKFDFDKPNTGVAFTVPVDRMPFE